MSALIAGHFILGSISVAHALYRILKPYRVGIYGPSQTGKTTLDQYMTVPGDIDPIPIHFRTTHNLDPKTNRYKMPKVERKLLRWKKEKKAISNTDIAGQAQFRNLWVEDMFGRNVEVVIYMVDHRVLNNFQFRLDAVAGFEYLIDNILNVNRTKVISRKAKKRGKNYQPKLFCLMINKMDLWWDSNAENLWNLNLKKEHPIVLPFRNGLKRMRKAGIRADIHAISAQHGINVEGVMMHLIDSM